MVAKNLARKHIPEPLPREASSTPLTGGRVHDVDRLIHEHIRLAIVSALAVNESLTFTDLKKLLDTTDGNLSIHARKLEDGGYIRCEKSFEGRVPKTEFRLTKQGRGALNRYLDHMEALIKAMRGAGG
ncbi:MAG TPA: transcriptional regulator [Bryobacteraceae bacterium]|nr:transcriptional regulator [Bryobacteraceae bacterium]